MNTPKGYITEQDRQLATYIKYADVVKHQWQSRMGKIWHKDIINPRTGKKQYSGEVAMVVTIHGIDRVRYTDVTDRFIYFESPRGKIYKTDLD